MRNPWRGVFTPLLIGRGLRPFSEIHNPIKNNEYSTDEITEAQGLERAYQHGDYYIHGDTMDKIAGYHTAKDWYDDVTKIPFWGDLRHSTRYRAARDALTQHLEVKRLVGHSLGGSVALVMNIFKNIRCASVESDWQRKQQC